MHPKVGAAAADGGIRLPGAAKIPPDHALCSQPHAPVRDPKVESGTPHGDILSRERVGRQIADRLSRGRAGGQ